MISKELVQCVRNSVAENPYMTVARLAEQLNAPEADVVTALPLGMRKKANLAELEDLWREMAEWKPVLVQFDGKRERLPRPGPGLLMGGLDAGESYRSEYAATLPSFDCICTEAIGSVWFVSNSLLSEGSHSIKVYDKEGAHVMSLHLGRDASGRVPAQSRAAFEAARARYGVTPVPRLGCGSGKPCAGHKGGCNGGCGCGHSKAAKAQAS